jgi:MFS family permease
VTDAAQSLPLKSLPQSPLGYRQYRELWTANAASNIGSQIQIVGAAWLMASLTSSPQLIAFVQTAINLPTMLFILAGGAIADNYDRRAIMLVAQSAMLILALLLAALTWLNLITPLLLLALTFAIAAFASFTNPCWQASVRDILPRDLISRAVALNSMSLNLARTAGPAFGGFIVSAAGVASAFALNALSFVGFIGALLRWKPETKPRTTPRERVIPAMAAGVRYGVLAPHIRNAALRGGFSGLSASAAFALLPVLARHDMNGGAVLYGLLLGAFGLGAIISAWLGGCLRGRLAPDQIIAFAVVGLAGGLALLAWTPNTPVAGIGAALCGAGWVLAHSTYNASVQLSAPAWVTARALAFYQTATFAGMAAGSAGFGWLAEHQSVAIAFLTASGAQALAGLVGLFLPLPRFEDLNIDPLNRWREPKVNVDVAPDDGPIVVELDYRIAPENAALFLQAMNDRRRIRRRDGALDWSLLQDLSHGERWTESYRVPNWAEYLRHNNRRTMADVENADLLRSLNLETEGPRVRRYLRHRTEG